MPLDRSRCRSETSRSSLDQTGTRTIVPNAPSTTSAAASPTAQSLFGRPRRARSVRAPNPRASRHRSTRAEERPLREQLPRRDQDVRRREIREHHPHDRDQRSPVASFRDHRCSAHHGREGDDRRDRDRAGAMVRDHRRRPVVHRESRGQKQQVRHQRPRRRHRPPSLRQSSHPRAPPRARCSAVRIRRAPRAAPRS